MRPVPAGAGQGLSPGPELNPSGVLGGMGPSTLHSPLSVSLVLDSPPRSEHDPVGTWPSFPAIVPQPWRGLALSPHPVKFSLSPLSFARLPGSMARAT